jgi:hypothetical protein
MSKLNAELVEYQISSMEDRIKTLEGKLDKLMEFLLMNEKKPETNVEKQKQPEATTSAPNVCEYIQNNRRRTII